MGIYQKFAPDFIDAGLPVFPVNAREKRPAVKGWQNVSARQSRAWCSAPSLADADGIGLLMGKPSGITEIDVDAVGDSWISAAIERFGETPVIIRTASGKGKLWYRHNGERRQIRPFKGEPIDILGGGFTVAPPSYRLDLGASYRFITGGLDDLHRLPVIRAAEGFTRAAEAVFRGERNDSLWRYCMAQARFCDDVEALIDVAVTWTRAMPEPLGAAEAERCARSAWGYEVAGKNFLGLKKPQVTAADRVMDALIDAPDALVLLQMFQRWHGNRPSFAIAPRAMSEAGSPPWPWKKIVAARDVLLERGFIVEVSAPERGKRAGRYRLAICPAGNVQIWT
ncbi:MAG: bifunctional DNA primase/polymerase [Paracoccus sp. (in: a-proteobacteria)]|uniref:bifunctional DNA primase/polymerase n=1 Tax=Paracoccus sp. TaxID=267 RepID=UPI0026E06FBC|nr:bifunctional DNA primase/polymerase [Paracoccus sp. (in: a-proteobacteria)]MDO5613634.1 bifunctional DNA primase/polymerase [Paracoccus sp. (in: a-proteobacteria)]